MHSGRLQQTGCFRFLSKIFQYFDVMVSLSLCEKPLGPLSTDTSVQPGIDGTFGLLGTFWPLMQRLAAVLATCQNPAVGVTSMDVEILAAQLEAWRPEETHPTLNEADTDHQAMLQIAKAYKYSSLLTLYTRMRPRVSYNFPIVDNADGLGYDRSTIQHTYQQALESLLRTCVLSGPMSTLVWPLYTVALLAQTVGDKTITQHIFSKLDERQHMQVVKAASDSVKRSWLQADLNIGQGAAGILLG